VQHTYYTDDIEAEISDSAEPSVEQIEEAEKNANLNRGEFDIDLSLHRHAISELTTELKEKDDKIESLQKEIKENKTPKRGFFGLFKRK
jgi:predicted RNase H-like nuclease (RuvC/YqgF family)